MRVTSKRSEEVLGEEDQKGRLLNYQAKICVMESEIKAALRHYIPIYRLKDEAHIHIPTYIHTKSRLPLITPLLNRA